MSANANGAGTGNLTLVSTNNAIDASGLHSVLTVAGTTSVDAGTGTITLSNTSNHFTGAVSLTGGASQIVDANALTLGTVNTGDLIVASHGALNLGKGTVTGALNANSGGGDISQSTALLADQLTVTGTTALNAGVGNITLNQVGNDFQGAVSLTGAATQLTDVNALTLGTVNTGALIVTSHGALNLGKGTLSSTVNAYSNGGAITQSTTLGDNLNIGGATMLDAGGTGTITLAQAGNNVTSTDHASGGRLSRSSVSIRCQRACSTTGSCSSVSINAPI